MENSRQYYDTPSFKPVDDSLFMLLKALLFHTINEIRMAEENLTVRLMRDFVATIWPPDLDPIDGNTDTAFNHILRRAIQREQALRAAFHEEHPLTGEFGLMDADDARKFMAERIPERAALESADHFFAQVYLKLDTKKKRALDLAYQGLLFTILTERDFDHLCKEKSLETKGMSVEEKMNLPLDHVIVHALLQMKVAA